MVFPDLNEVRKCGRLCSDTAELSEWSLPLPKIVLNFGAFGPGLKDGRPGGYGGLVCVVLLADGCVRQ